MVIQTYLVTYLPLQRTLRVKSLDIRYRFAIFDVSMKLIVPWTSKTAMRTL